MLGYKRNEIVKMANAIAVSIDATNREELELILNLTNAYQFLVGVLEEGHI